MSEVDSELDVTAFEAALRADLRMEHDEGKRLELVRLVRLRVNEADRVIRELVAREARNAHDRHGRSWEWIGERLGVSHQRAQQIASNHQPDRSQR